MVLDRLIRLRTKRAGKHDSVKCSKLARKSPFFWHMELVTRWKIFFDDPDHNYFMPQKFHVHKKQVVLSCGKSCKTSCRCKNYQEDSKLIDESTCSWDRHLRSPKVYIGPSILCVYSLLDYQPLHFQMLTSISSRGPRHVHPFISMVQLLSSERNSFWQPLSSLTYIHGERWNSNSSRGHRTAFAKCVHIYYLLRINRVPINRTAGNTEIRNKAVI